MEDHKAQTLKTLSLNLKYIPSQISPVHSKGYGSLPKPGLHLYLPSQETLGTCPPLPVKHPQTTDSHKEQDQPEGSSSTGTPVCPQSFCLLRTPSLNIHPTGLQPILHSIALSTLWPTCGGAESLSEDICISPLASRSGMKQDPVSARG